MRTHTSDNDGTVSTTSSDVGALATLAANEATNLSPENDQAQQESKNGLPWVPPEYYVTRVKGELTVFPTAVAIAQLTELASNISQQPEFEFAPTSEEAGIIRNIADTIKLHLENDRGISEYWAKETIRFETQRAGYNAAFAAKQLMDAMSRFERVSKEHNDAVEDEMYNKLFAGYQRAGREATLQIRALYAALDVVSIDFGDSAKRVLETQARKYWTPRVREVPSEQKKTDRSNESTLSIMRAAMTRKTA